MKTLAEIYPAYSNSASWGDKGYNEVWLNGGNDWIYRHLIKAAQRMVKMQAAAFPQSAADIVIIGSVAGRHITPFSAAYSASKHAVHALAEGLRRDIGPKGVRVSLVQPGIVISGFQAGAHYTDELVDGFHEKFGPLPSCSDIADTIAFVVSQPPHVNISDIVVRSTRQDYP